jgi:hypothetical protein
MDQVEGAWSTGEFGTMLIDLLSPATAAEFHYRRDERTSGVNTKVYDYSVKRENSHWQITMGSQTYRPPYKGSIWVDPATSRVLRIEMQAFGFPGRLPHRRCGVRHGLPIHAFGRRQAIPFAGPRRDFELPARLGFLQPQRDRFPQLSQVLRRIDITFGDAIKK